MKKVEKKMKFDFDKYKRQLTEEEEEKVDDGNNLSQVSIPVSIPEQVDVNY